MHCVPFHLEAALNESRSALTRDRNSTPYALSFYRFVTKSFTSSYTFHSCILLAIRFITDASEPKVIKRELRDPLVIYNYW